MPPMNPDQPSPITRPGDWPLDTYAAMALPGVVLERADEAPGRLFRFNSGRWEYCDPSDDCEWWRSNINDRPFEAVARMRWRIVADYDELDDELTDDDQPDVSPEG